MYLITVLGYQGHSDNINPVTLTQCVTCNMPMTCQIENKRTLKKTKQ